MDTPLYKGNSGGGLFNADGKLIGITNAGDLGDQNINFAVPIQIVKRTTDNILHYASDSDETTNGVYKITLGVTVTGQNSRYVYDTAKGYGAIKEEVCVKEVAENSIAMQMGLQTGDILTGMIVDGETLPINRYFVIGDVLLTMRVGSKCSFIIKRGEQTLTTIEYTISRTDLAVVA
jgi:S1-C subfamily serine protease